MERTICFVDGFNLYHAINDLKKPHLKWLDLSKLASVFVEAEHQSLEGIYYFSAFAKWLTNSYKRHRQYIRALEAASVHVEMSSFYKKERKCGASCRQKYIGHEEKQSDVKLAIWMFDQAFRGRFDRALLITADSDLAPAVKMISNRFPDKKFVLIAPPDRRLSDQLAQCVGKKHKKSIKEIHLERCLFPKEVKNSDGNVVARRPEEYEPPGPPRRATVQDLQNKFNQ